LITHLGIITLLIGSLIGRIWGIEGTITLFKGESPTNRLLADQRQLRVHDIDGILKGYPAEFLHHPPTPQHPRNLGRLASGTRLRRDRRARTTVSILRNPSLRSVRRQKTRLDA